MKIGVVKEIFEGERRCSSTPEVTEKLIKMGYSVLVESGAGEKADYLDSTFQQVGAEVIESTEKVWKDADIILKVRGPMMNEQLGKHEVDLLHEGQTLISFLWPAQNESLLKELAEKKVTVLAMDSVPRISRAQKMDALSSMANIAGYRAVVEASQHFGSFFTGQITAAGKIPPAKVLVIGAGVAGLAAIGTASGLGAIVRAFDTRPVVKEQVESMGGEFLELDFEEDGTGEGGYAKVMSEEFIKAEMELFARQAMDVDIIITTALIPGRPAPELITAGMVETMKEGSVIVDLAAETGGNCALTQKDKIVVKHGVTIVGYTDLPSRLARQASRLYAMNLYHLLNDMTPGKNGELVVDFEDEVVRGATVVKEGDITWPPPAPRLTKEPETKEKTPEPSIKKEETPKKTMPLPLKVLIQILIGGGLLGIVGAFAPPKFMQHFTVFVLACFVGNMVIWNVTASLHTPLMSVTNAISSIVILGAIVQVSTTNTTLLIIAGIAILITSINIAGGFAVTQRMLRMFRK